MPAAARQRPPLLGAAGERGEGGAAAARASGDPRGRRAHLEELRAEAVHRQSHQARQARHELCQQRAALRAALHAALVRRAHHLQRLQRADARQHRRQIDRVVLLRHRLQHR